MFPDHSRLADIAISGRPVRVSADDNGNLYVMEAARHSVTKYSPRGEVLFRISLSAAPTAIRVSDSGLLYIGSKGRIEIFSGTTLLRTVTGVSLPAAIDVSSAGAIYAADAEGCCVKIISVSGDVTVVGGRDRFGSDLRDLALDEMNNELYLLDRNEPVSDYYVWRVAVYDLNGNFLRSFSHYGYATEGALVSASSIAVDSRRRVYVADNVQNIIGVFDHAGVYLGSIFDRTDPYYNPVDLDYRNDRLYITSFLGRRVTVLGLDGYADLSVMPDSIELNVQGEYLNGNREVVLMNTGRGQVVWNAASEQAWLSISRTSGMLGSGMTENAAVTIDPAGLSAGRHSGRITFDFNGGSSVLSVVINVLSPPVLTVSASDMEIQVRAGASAYRQVSVELANDLSGSGWTASSDSGWLTLSPASGVSNAVTLASVNVNTSGMTAGTYSGKIAVTAAGASSSPALISVVLTVVADNSIQVMTNNQNAVFSITGPQSYSGSGSSWAAGNVPDGTYTITYGALSGYMAPASETITVSGGRTITFTGNYAAISRGSIVVTLNGSTDPTLVRVFDMSGNVREFEAFENVTGGLATSVNDLDGDGLNEIVASVRHGSSLVGIFDGSGRSLARTSLFAEDGMFDITTADLDGDGHSELIASKTSGVRVIRVLRFSQGRLINTGIRFRPFDGEPGNAMLAGAGDMDGDGRTDIIAVLASEGKLMMRVWSPDTSDAPGMWTVSLKKEIVLPMQSGTFLKGLSVRPAEDSGTDEVIIMQSNGVMTTIRGDGSSWETAFSVRGVTDMDTGDPDNDGKTEIITGSKTGKVRVFSPEGIEIRSIGAFRTVSGVRVSAGTVGGTE